MGKLKEHLLEYFDLVYNGVGTDPVKVNRLTYLINVILKMRNEEVTVVRTLTYVGTPEEIEKAMRSRRVVGHRIVNDHLIVYEDIK